MSDSSNTSSASEPFPSRPKRKAAEKARELFSKLNSVSTDVNVICKHGWDYEKMLQSFYDDEEDVYMTSYAQVNQDYVIESDSPTFDSSSSENFEDANTDETSDNDSQPPALPPRLPTNLNQVQNLSDQLQIPEVQEAASPALADIIENMRDFNSQHPRPPPWVPRRSARVPSKPRPLDYSVYDKTGRK